MATTRSNTGLTNTGLVVILDAGRTFFHRVQHVKVKAHEALKAVQLARMMSVLSNLNDHQLAQIGISRNEIQDYAKMLMANETGN